MQEEAGVDIINEYLDVTPFGYYTVNQKENDQDIQFLQLRFYLFMKEKAQKLDFNPIENLNDPDPIKIAKEVGLEEIEEFIPWLVEGGEYAEIKKRINKKNLN